MLDKSSCLPFFLSSAENVDGGIVILYPHALILVLFVWKESAQWLQKVITIDL